MEVGHATPGANTALSVCLSGVARRAGEEVWATSSALPCTRTEVPGHSLNTTQSASSLANVSLPSACRAYLCDLRKRCQSVCAPQVLHM